MSLLRRLSDRLADRPVLVGLALAELAFFVFLASGIRFDAGRGDFFYLADAFLHGRTWLDVRPGPSDVILLDGRVYVPFGPFPAVLLMPLVAAVGPRVADAWEPLVNAGLGAAVVGLAFRLAGRLGVRGVADRAWLVLLLGFSTQVWWVASRGGVWHTGHLVATCLSLLLLAELAGRRRPLLVGLLLGAAFLTRAPVAFAAPFVALWWTAWPGVLDGGRALADRVRAVAWRPAVATALGVLPAVLFFLAYNAVRFGSPLESGYGLATLPDWLAEVRAKGTFALVHVPMNLDYLFLHLPRPIPEFPWFRPDGLGMSVLLTSPGLLLAFRAPRHDPRTWLLLGATVAVLVPTLLYYGGGWLQYGYRYFLDSIPYLWAMACLGVAARGPVPVEGRLAIAFGMLVGLGGVYWTYNL